MLRGLHGVMGVFGRITMLVDENTYAVNFFIQALLQLLDRSIMSRTFHSLFAMLAVLYVVTLRTLLACVT